MSIAPRQTVLDRSRLDAVLADFDQRALTRLATPGSVKPSDDTERTRFCETCGRRVTIGTDGETEYGHRRAGWTHDDGDRCPERPSNVDPRRECGRA